MSAYYPQSKVEIQGFVARHYDALLDLVSFGRYSSFIKKSIAAMQIKPEDKILDLGAGSGRNACFIIEYLSERGELVGIDISQEMISHFRKKCTNHPNAKIVEARIDQPLPLKKKFDKVFISFVLHGFPQEIRKVIVKNAFELLRNNGNFFILDYNECVYAQASFYFKLPFKLVECPYAFDFIRRDWKQILAGYNFGEFKEYCFFKNYIRLLKAKKLS